MTVAGVKVTVTEPRADLVRMKRQGVARAYCKVHDLGSSIVYTFPL